MLRRTLAAVLIAPGLATVATAPAQAGPSYDNSIGKITAPTQVWRGKCAKYTIRWKFTPPAESTGWTVVSRIRTPKGFAIRSEFWDSEVPPPNKLGRLQGQLKVPLCGSSIKPGRYKIEMQMIYSVGDRDSFTVDRAPTYFRLVRKKR